MIRWKALLAAAIAIAVLVSGCTAKLTAKREGSDTEEGIPFYLPKPFIFVTKNLEWVEALPPSAAISPKPTKPEQNSHTGDTSASAAVAEGLNQKAGALASPRTQYSLRIVYLPDFGEKYRLKISATWGEVNSEVNLVDGWKLVGVNIESDAKFSDNLTAIGGLIPSLSSLFGVDVSAKAMGLDLEAMAPTLFEKAAELDTAVWLFEIVKKDGVGSVDVKCVWVWTEKDTTKARCPDSGSTGTP